MRRPTDPRLLGTATFVGLALVAVGMTGAILDSGPPWTPLAATAMAPLPPCGSASELNWSHRNGETIDPTATTALFWNAMLIACPWSPGTLTVTLRGTIAAGIGTRAVLVQGPNRLLDVELRNEERTFEVDVPASGQILLAFVNDYYDPPEDRNLWVSGLEFTPRAP